ncbi:hypothetical protein PROFUN_08713 [Planoprotostelium fungivorum]|uniref:THUMP domain-containing protein n=1 Tax=Planoprotostelium fungivorum TaxID=1890364 RepID=A0A2P6MQW4_9EUKA|nr:hypothetical protein PROFUN_08713 [Planoprotostelium fungivorum]
MPKNRDESKLKEPQKPVTPPMKGLHAYKSPQAASILGGVVQERYGWKVDLEHYDLMISIIILGRDVLICIFLFKLDARYRAPPVVEGFKPVTSLNPATSAALVLLSFDQYFKTHRRYPQFVLDPVCGIGTIPIEGEKIVEERKIKSQFIGTDMYDASIQQARANMEMSRTKGELWVRDSMQGSMRKECIDVILADLPFGRRHGSHNSNQKLYPRLLKQFSRSLCTGGQMYLLTSDSNLLWRVVKEQTATSTMGITLDSMRLVVIGGLACQLMTLTKTSPFLWKEKEKGNANKKQKGGDNDSAVTFADQYHNHD